MGVAPAPNASPARTAQLSESHARELEARLREHARELEARHRVRRAEEAKERERHAQETPLPNAQAYVNRGLDSKGDFDRAIADFTQAIRLDPKYLEAYLYRAVAYQNKGDNDRAIADYSQLIRAVSDRLESGDSLGPIDERVYRH